jgi:hypothetical protein
MQIHKFNAPLHGQPQFLETRQLILIGQGAMIQFLLEFHKSIQLHLLAAVLLIL